MEHGDRVREEAPRVVEVEETASTNALAMAMASDGVRGPLWITAVRQTAGRGRGGRRWVSLPGNLHATLLLTPACGIQAAAGLSLVAGVAVIEAIRSAAGPRTPDGLRLKWPNDVLVGRSKVGGILIESSTAAGGETSGGVLVVAVGIGLNLVAHPDDPDRPLTDLARHGIAIDRGGMLALLAGRMAAWLGRWDAGRGFALVRQAWENCAGPPGEPISVHAGAERVAGRYMGLDPTGALLMTDDSGREHRFTFGDVTLLDGTPGARGSIDRRVPGAGK